jgi:hypothetical protein
MSRSHHLTDEEIAAAQLRVVLDEKLGRTTPELVTRIANALPGDPITLGDEPSSVPAALKQEPPSPEATETFIDIAIPGDTFWSVIQFKSQHEKDPQSGRAKPVIRTFNFEKREGAQRSPGEFVQQPWQPIGSNPVPPARSAGNYPVNTPMYKRLTGPELQKTLKNAAEELEKAAEQLGELGDGPAPE